MTSMPRADLISDAVPPFSLHFFSCGNLGPWAFPGCFLYGQMFPTELHVSICEIVLKVTSINF